MPKPFASHRLRQRMYSANPPGPPQTSAKYNSWFSSTIGTWNSAWSPNLKDSMQIRDGGKKSNPIFVFGFGEHPIKHGVHVGHLHRRPINKEPSVDGFEYIKALSVFVITTWADLFQNFRLTIYFETGWFFRINGVLCKIYLSFLVAFLQFTRKETTIFIRVHFVYL